MGTDPHLSTCEQVRQVHCPMISLEGSEITHLKSRTNCSPQKANGVLVCEHPRPAVLPLLPPRSTSWTMALQQLQAGSHSRLIGKGRRGTTRLGTPGCQGKTPYRQTHARTVGRGQSLPKAFARSPPSIAMACVRVFVIARQPRGKKKLTYFAVCVHTIQFSPVPTPAFFLHGIRFKPRFVSRIRKGFVNMLFSSGLSVLSY